MDDSRRGPLPQSLVPLSWIAARVYGAVVAWRNARFDRGIGVETLRDAQGRAVPVVSVGNLTAGGTGKTPFVSWVAQALAQGGAHPVIALRGYRAARDEQGALRSDEAMEHALASPTATVVVDPRRREAIARVLRSGEAESWRARPVVVLDDGFQHRQLARGLDIVLVDATRPGLDGDLLPNGWLRERAAGIRRAHLVVLTKADDPALRARATELVLRCRGVGPDAVCAHAWRSLWIHGADRGAGREEPVAWMRGRRVVAASGLGNPASFESMVRAAGAEIVATVRAGDHRALDPAELARVAQRSGADGVVVVTRKDLVKLASHPPGTTVVVPELSIRFIEGERSVLARLDAMAR